MVLHICDDMIEERRCRCVAVGFNHSFQPVVPELFLSAIHRFAHPVRAHHNNVAGIEMHEILNIREVVQHTERNSTGLEPFHRRIG